MGSSWTTTQTKNHKLINFNVPNYLITNFDELVKFKRITRTSMLIRLIESYMRSEVTKMKDDDKINHLIQDVKLRNNNPTQKLKQLNETQSPPYPIFQEFTEDEYDWEERLRNGY